MKYFKIMVTNYYRTICGNCAPSYDNQTFPIKTEEERKEKCFNCGEDRPIEAQAAVRS